MNAKEKKVIQKKTFRKILSNIFESGILRYFSVVAIGIYSSQTISSQDFITFPNGEFLKVKIIETGTVEIKYSLYNSVSGQQYTIERNKVYNVRYESGLIDFLNGRTVMVSPQTTVNNLQQSNSGGTQMQKQAATGATAVTAAKPTTVATAMEPASTVTTGSEAISPTTEQFMASLLSGSTTATPGEKKSLYGLYTAQLNNAEAVAKPAAGKESKRPTAFRNYGGLINIGIISEYSEFAGVNLLFEGAFENSDFGVGLEFNILDLTYDLGVRLSHHIPATTFLDPYYGLRVFAIGTHDTEEFEELGADFFVGTRLMFKKVGLFTEYHLNEEYLKLGISFSL